MRQEWVRCPNCGFLVRPGYVHKYSGVTFGVCVSARVETKAGTNG